MTLRTNIGGRLLAVLTAALVLTAATATTATADTTTATQRVEQTYRDSVGVFHYAFDPAEIPSARIQRVQGSKQPSGECSIEHSTTRNARDRVMVVGTEISFDPTNCVSEYAVATYPLDAVPSSVRAAFPRQTERADVTAATSYYYAWFVVRYKDPVNLSVNWVRSSQGWYSNGNRTHYNDTWWLTETGWYRTSSSSANWGATTNTRAAFSNNTFCVVDPTTWTNYAKVAMTTTLSGGATTSQSTSKGGGCSGWLSSDWSLDFL